MARVQWKVSELPSRLLERLNISKFFKWIILLRRTLFYNQYTSWTVAVETGFEPLFCTLERFSKYFGPVSVYCADFIISLRYSVILSQDILLLDPILVSLIAKQNLVYKIVLRPKKKLCLFPVTCLKILGSVGRENLFFIFNFFFTNFAFFHI